MNPRQRIESELRGWLRDHHGVIGYTEALRLGASPGVIRSQVQRGEWAPILQGVYRHTAAPSSPYQDLRAGCVYTAGTGGFGVVSHQSAAWVWGLLSQPPTPPELTIPYRTRDFRRCVGLRIHQSRDLDATKAVHFNKILVCNPLRTLVDVAGVILPRELTEAVDNALATRLLTLPGLEAEIERLSRSGRPGVGALRRHLLDQGYTGVPHPSVLESRTWRLIKATGLPLPTRECHAGPDGEYRLDFAWAGVLLAVEVDGYRWHFSPAHSERDETRRRLLRRAGWTLNVYSWREVLDDPGRLTNEITQTYRDLARAR